MSRNSFIDMATRGALLTAMMQTKIVAGTNGGILNPGSDFRSAPRYNQRKARRDARRVNRAVKR